MPWRNPLAGLPDPVVVGARPALIARVVGTLYVTGGATVILSIALPHPAQTKEGPMLALAAGACLAGLALLRWPDAVSIRWLHVAIATGSALICAAVFLSGIATGVYSAMFVWVVLLTAYFFPGWRAMAHLAWLLVAYALTLALLDESAGFTPGARWLLTSITLLVASAICSWLIAGRARSEHALRREVAARERLELELRHLADHDPLTGLPNRRFFDAQVPAIVTRSERDGIPLCLAAVDLDRFKAFNDARGHPEGDALLRAAAAAWRGVLRGGDLILRIGGDEFAILLPDTDPRLARRVIERVREATPMGQTCSVGLACRRDGERLDSLMARADEFLYEHKARLADAPVLASSPA